MKKKEGVGGQLAEAGCSGVFEGFINNE